MHPINVFHQTIHRPIQHGMLQAIEAFLKREIQFSFNKGLPVVVVMVLVAVEIIRIEIL